MKQTPSFVIKDHQIAIYGGGINGKDVATRLLHAGLNVSCIVDSNPTDVIGSPVPVKTAIKCFDEHGDIIVFISLRNALSHYEVAKSLNAVGFSKLIFLPLYLQSKAAKWMIEAWRLIFEGIYTVEIPVYESLWDVNPYDFVLDDSVSGFVSVIIHKQHIFIRAHYDDRYSKENPYGSYAVWGERRYSINKIKRGVSICDESVLSYFSENSVDYIKKNNYYKGCMFNPGEFFQAGALPAELNENGVFFLLEGHHRASFLLNSGFTGIPLRIRKTDWEAYFQERYAKELMDYCRNLDYLPKMVLHPAFIKLPVDESIHDAKFDELINQLLPKRGLYI